MVVISKDLENTIKNKFVVPYLTILKDNQYLVITDEDDVIQGRFVNNDDNLIEIFNIYNTKEVEKYVEWMYPLSFFVRDIDKWELLKFNVFDRKGYVQFMKNNLKKSVEQVIKFRGDDNDTYSMMKEKIEKYAAELKNKIDEAIGPEPPEYIYKYVIITHTGMKINVSQDKYDLINSIIDKIQKEKEK